MEHSHDGGHCHKAKKKAPPVVPSFTLTAEPLAGLREGPLMTASFFAAFVLALEVVARVRQTGTRRRTWLKDTRTA